MKKLLDQTLLVKCTKRIVLICSVLSIHFLSSSQTGTVGSPFTQLGMARNVTSAGVYYFNLTGTTFSTYVDANGWVMVAIDQGGSSGDLPQGTALSYTTRGILNTTPLSKLGSANEVRFSSSTGNVDVVTTNTTVRDRVTQNYSISRGAADNTINSSWTGTNTNGTSFLGSGCTNTVTNLNSVVYHSCGNGGGLHWVQVSNLHSENNTGNEITSAYYFRLWVRAALVAVVNGPTINTQPSSSAQNLCLNSTPTDLSVSATANSGSLTYQWYSNTSASNSGGSLISGATSSTYTPPTNASGVKYYYVICTDSQGSTTSSVTSAITTYALSVSGSVSSDQTICSGTSPSSIVLSGNTGTVQWQISSDNSSFSDISGATSTTLVSGTIGSLSATKYYKAVVTNGTCSSVNSGTVTISVTSAPTITSSTAGSGCGTGTVSLSATASAGTVNWYAAASGGSSLGTGNTFVTPSISTTTTYYAGSTDGSCSSASRTAVIATINALPTETVSGTATMSIDILVVGGGGGAGYFRGGGGGGGGYIYTPGYTYNSGTSTAITVGVGGNGGTDNAGTGVHATSGTNSSFGSTYVAVGGGGGGSYGGLAQNGYSGGSGGGGGNQSSSANTGYGGSGTSGQGYGGGNSRCGGGGEVSGGGGGGAGGAGSSGSSSGCGSCSYRPYNPGSGGNGLQNSISGTATYYCGGGGGGGLAGNCTTGTNSMGANGLGGGQSSYGGGGQCKVTSNVFTAENGGPGIVIIRYLGTPVATGGTITQSGGYTIHTFTTSGTFAYSSTPTTSVTDVTRCGAGTVSFTATASSGYTLNWYDASTGGNLLASSTLTYTTPSLNQTTAYYVATQNSSTGCLSANRTAVNAILTSTGAVNSNQTICTGMTPANIVLSSYTGTTQWQSSTDNSTFNPISGQTGATLTGATIGALNADSYYRASITNGGCTAYSPVVTISVNAFSIATSANNGDMVWNGTTSTGWTTNSNWYQYNGSSFVTASSLPTASTNVIIPQAQSCVLNQPSTLTGNVNVNNVLIETGATLTMSTGTLSVYGNLENYGTLTPGTGTIQMIGSVAQEITGITTFYNLTCNNSSTGITLNSPIKVSGTLTMTQGNIITSAANLLEIGTNGTTLGSVNWTAGTVVGPMKRWFGTSANSTQASGIFPIGNSSVNRYARINFTQAPGVAGYILAEYISGAPMVGGVALYAGLPAVINGQVIQNYENEGYYEITPYNSSNVAYGALNTSAYDLTLRGNQLTTITNLSVLRIIKSSNHLAWNDNPSGDGTHVTPVGTTSDFTIGASGMTGFSWFDIGSSSDNVLPVELISFSASCSDNNSVEVRWTTASEHNSSHFILNKSRDGLNWVQADSIVSAGNSTSIIDYSFEDFDVFAGNNYYRLSQFDQDGAFVTYDVISANCIAEESNSSMQLFPNPNNGEFTIEFTSTEDAEEGRLFLMDSKGLTIVSENVKIVKGQNMFPMNQFGLTGGIYFVKLIVNGISITERVSIR